MASEDYITHISTNNEAAKAGTLLKLSHILVSMSALSDSFYKGLLERHPLFYSIFVIHEYSSELGVYDGAKAWDTTWDDIIIC